MEAQQFFGGVVRFVGVMSVFVIISLLAGLAPLLVGIALGQKRLGVYGLIAAAISVFIAGPLVGVVPLLLVTTIVLVISLKRRRSATASANVGNADRREQ